MNLRNYLKNLVKRGFLKKEEIGIDQIRALLSGASKNILSALLLEKLTGTNECPGPSDKRRHPNLYMQS